jgi:hypothetical protein
MRCGREYSRLMMTTASTSDHDNGSDLQSNCNHQVFCCDASLLVRCNPNPLIQLCWNLCAIIAERTPPKRRSLQRLIKLRRRGGGGETSKFYVSGITASNQSPYTSSTDLFLRPSPVNPLHLARDLDNVGRMNPYPWNHTTVDTNPPEFSLDFLLSTPISGLREMKSEDEQETCVEKAVDFLPWNPISDLPATRKKDEQVTDLEMAATSSTRKD